MTDMEAFAIAVEDYLRSGEKLLSFASLSFLPGIADGKMTCTGVEPYWFQYLWTIVPDPLSKPISRDEEILKGLLEAGTTFPEHSQVISSYQVSLERLEVVLERSVNDLDEVEKRFHYYNSLLRQEFELTKEQLVREVFGEKDREVKKGFVCSIQEAIVGYSGLIRRSQDVSRVNWHHELSADLTEQDLMKLTLQYLDGLAVHLCRNYQIFINQKLEAPFSYRSDVAIRKEREILFIREMLENNVVSSVLSSAIRELVDGIDSAAATTTFEGLGFAITLLVKLKEIFAKSEGESYIVLKERIVDLFLRNGLNTFSFWYLLIKDYQETLDILPTGEKEQFLQGCLTKFEELGSVHENTSVLFNPDLPSLADQVIAWVRKELSYLQEDKVITEITTRKPKKMEFDGTVAELGVIAWAAYKVRLIRGVSKADLNRHLVAGISTREVPRISEKSMYNKMTEPDFRSIPKVQEKIQEILDVLERVKNH